jgi:hypothetical protein
MAADLENFDERWTASGVDRMMLRDVRGKTNDLLVDRFDHAVGREIVAKLDAYARPDGISDEEAVRLEHLARSTRRAGEIARQLGRESGEMPGQAYLESYRERILAQSREAPGARSRAVLMEQIRLVELLFGPDAAMSIYEEACHMNEVPIPA